MSMRTFSANFHYYDFKHPGAPMALNINLERNYDGRKYS